MAIAEYKTGSPTVSSTEYSLVTPGTTLANDTTKGTYQVFIDSLAMTTTDEYRFRVYEKVTSGGTKRIVYETTLYGAQIEALAFPALILMWGWDVTIQKLAGTDRTFPFSIRKVA